MDLPIELRQKIAELTTEIKAGELKNAAQGLSERYRQARADGKSLLGSETDVLSYAATRMPATYAAVYWCLEKLTEVYDEPVTSLVDVGAGTGAAGWAADACFDLQHITFCERDKNMAAVGQSLATAATSEALRGAEWRGFDLNNGAVLPSAELVTASYVLNELSEEAALNAAQKMWRAAGKVLLIVEPGTPKAFTRLLKIRDSLCADGANVLAPCPHNGKCPLVGDDWCHFACRVARSKLHKQLKSASMGYEDEKFCFMAFGRQVQTAACERIIKPVKISKAMAVFEVCRSDGKIARQNVAARDKAAYKAAKKCDWGDKIS